TTPPQDDPPPQDDGGDPADDTPAGPETGLFPPVTDLTAPGPYTPVTVSNTGPGGNYSLYHPEELAPDGVLNPIVGWGSGGSTNPSWYTLLPHLASHGFVVIGSNSIPGIGGEVGQGQELVAGVDWLIEENGRAGSTFEGKLDTTRIAASGYSMGSLATFTVADDPRWVTTVHISGGLMNKADIQKLHAPAAFICGETDIANPNCATDFEMVSTPVFYGVIQGADHLGVMLSPYMEIFRSATTGWLRWHLMEDRTMAPDFVGPDCTLCTDSQWVVQQNALDP
ncbi:MAG: hypothetical protein OXT09_24200, partial [Myxococcales bacterium]|nr:hypothetical protein [Myxococcales bacterium]